jgi:hypothetical protein
MDSAEEWKQIKLEWLEHLRGMSFELADYKAPSAEYNHDHCEGCGAAFAEFEGKAVHRSGYFTTITAAAPSPEDAEFIRDSRTLGFAIPGQPASGATRREWVCQKCFEEFREALSWQIKAPT